MNSSGCSRPLPSLSALSNLAFTRRRMSWLTASAGTDASPPALPAVPRLGGRAVRGSPPRAVPREPVPMPLLPPLVTAVSQTMPVVGVRESC
jgi:hypothetical protein